MEKNIIKYSIIIPVYNTENYLRRCLDSLVNQTTNNYEVIIVNDGSTDNSQDIIDEYVNKYKNFKSYNKKNGGLSDARNFGVKKSMGDYLLFLDSDDAFDYELIERLNSVISFEDLIRFQCQKIFSSDDSIYIPTVMFDNLSGKLAFKELLTNNFLEPATLYAYRKDFYIENNFKFANNKFHEDFGLVPLIILKAKNVSSIPYYGYLYYEREDSITANNNYEKEYKKAFDMLDHFDYLYANSRKFNNQVFDSFLANSLLLKIDTLNKKDKSKYILELRKRKISKLLLTDNLKRFFKKMYIKIRYGV